MAGIFTAKVLASGQLPSAKATLYAIPALTSAYIKKIKCVNVGATTEHLIIYKRADGTNDREIGRATLLPGERFEIESELAETGDLIRGVTTNAATVDYVIDGVEET